VWVSPDPYYGYGHYPVLVCIKCEKYVKNTYGPFHEKSHKYRPSSDDYFLGFTEKPPLNLGWGGGDVWCWDCDRFLYDHDTCLHLKPAGKLCKNCAEIRYDTNQCYDVWKLREELKNNSKYLLYQQKCEEYSSWCWNWFQKHKNQSSLSSEDLLLYVDKLLTCISPTLPKTISQHIIHYIDFKNDNTLKKCK